jgi:hypothetical protein
MKLIIALTSALLFATACNQDRQNAGGGTGMQEEQQRDSFSGGDGRPVNPGTPQ